MFESKPALPVGRAFEELETKEFTFVNDCFQFESNAAIGHYGQTLITHNLFYYEKIINPCNRFAI
ncbi:MAG: hypothetical protein A2X01_11015 [Bacteroidetes bacterium GWF2_35_48]|nr:MAG: hypothetical protein A2X01_11015 [Bacteroidetes bacterium GWF2_35_48]